MLDFGLVKPAGRDEPTAAALTGAHGARARPAFMAPEQALGDRAAGPARRPLRARLRGYWLVTGKPVFTGSTPDRHDGQARPRRPSRPLGAPSGDIPPEFDEFVLACLVEERRTSARPAPTWRRGSHEIPNRGGWTAESARTWWGRRRPRRHH